MASCPTRAEVETAGPPPAGPESSQVWAALLWAGPREDGRAMNPVVQAHTWHLQLQRWTTQPEHQTRAIRLSGLEYNTIVVKIIKHTIFPSEYILLSLKNSHIKKISCT